MMNTYCCLFLIQQGLFPSPFGLYSFSCFARSISFFGMVGLGHVSSLAWTDGRPEVKQYSPSGGAGYH